MPFDTIDELPKHIKKFSRKIQSQWRQVFNSVFNKLTKEGKSKKVAEQRAFMAANSILKKRFSRENQIHNHSDYFNQAINNFLGNLKG